MKRLVLASLLSIGMLTGCATAPRGENALHETTNLITPEAAIIRAANAAPEGVPGTFLMLVQATGTERGRVFLNSQLDYRDQRNLTIALTPQAHRQLAERLGADPMVALKGKQIVVRGTAVRTRIDLLANGRPTGKYYYQTHVHVTDATQLAVR